MQSGGTTIANPAPYRGLVAGLFAQDFPAAQGVWVEGFLTLLVELRRVFGNDIDKVIILSAIGQQFLTDSNLRPFSRADAEQADFASAPRRTTNIDALARATGIPRESVRRKVNELVAAGLVERPAQGGLRIGHGAAARLERSTGVSVEMLDTLFAAYLAMLVARGRVPPLPTP